MVKSGNQERLEGVLLNAFFKKNLAGRKGGFYTGMAGFGGACRPSHRCGNGGFTSCSTERTQHSCQQNHEPCRLRLLRDERGSVIDFLLSAAIIFFMIFAGVDYYVVQTQHNVAEHIMHYYLERVRMEGFLSSSDESEMLMKYGSVGMTVESIACPRQSQGAARVLRNPQNLDGSRINFTVTLKPLNRPMTSGLLIGASAAPDTFRVKVGGSALSERPTP